MAFVLGEVWATKEWLVIFVFSFISNFFQYIIKREKGADQIKIAVILCIFFIMGMKRMEKEGEKDIYFSLTQTKAEVLVEGTIDIIEKTSYGKRVYLIDCHVFSEEIEDKEKKSPVILLHVETDFSGKAGNRMSVKGELQAFSPPRNLGEFDAWAYYKAMGIDYKIKVSSFEIIDNSYHYLKQFLIDGKEHLSQIFFQICSQKDYGIFQAILLGEKQELDSMIKQLYQENGISHILAISGLHISLIGMGIYRFLRKGMGFFKAGIMSAFFMAGYVIMTGGGVSSLRAYAMFVILLLSYILGRTYDMLSAASLIAGILLWKSPFLLYHSGFLLSFGAVVGIEEAKILKRYLHCNSKLEEAFVSSFTVFLITLPILCYYYFEIAPYSIVLNLFIIPCMTWIVISGLMGMIGGLLSLSLGKFLIGMGHFLLVFYEQVCRWVQKLPKASLLIGRPSMFQIAVYYLCFIIIGYLVFYQNKIEKEKEICKKERHKRMVYVIIITIMLIASLSFKERGKLQIVFLDVSQGDGIYIETPSKTTYFIDGGSADIQNLAKNRIIPFLKAKQIEKLDYVIITHTDQDHIAGMMDILEEKSIQIKTLLLPQTNLKEESYQNLVSLAEGNQIKIMYLKRGDKIIDGEVKIECLHPREDFIAKDKNEYSTVLGMTYREFSALFTGDLENEGEIALLEHGLSSYDVLKVAHHGSKNATTEKLLEKVKPDIAVISCGIENRYGHPHREVLDRLEGIRIYQTKEAGAITIKTDGNQIEITTHLTQ